MSPIQQEYITVTGARENNLRDVSVRVPKRRITAFVGCRAPAFPAAPGLPPDALALLVADAARRARELLTPRP